MEQVIEAASPEVEIYFGLYRLCYSGNTEQPVCVYLEDGQEILAKEAYLSGVDGYTGFNKVADNRLEPIFWIEGVGSVQVQDRCVYIKGFNADR